MAKTVDNFSTIEDFRKTYNELAFDVGDISGLRDALKAGNNDTLVDAINVLEDKQFFFQEFEFIATTNQVSFNGADAGGNTLIYKDEKVQVFKNEEHLRENVDYQVALPSGSSHTGITLIGEYASGQSKAMASGDRLTIYSFTGAFIGTNITGDVSSFFQKTAENTIQNINANGVILNGDNSSATTALESGFTLQLAGRTFAEDDIITTTAGKKFQAPIISDSVASLQSGSLTSAVNGTFSGTVQAEQLTTTDDLTVGDGAAINGDLAVLGNSALFGSANQIGNSSSDVLEIQGDLNMTSAVITSNFLPKVNNNVTLGSSSKKWSNVHSTTFTGNLTGNVTGDVLSTGGQTILDSGTDGTNATARLSTITNDGSTTVLNVATGLLTGTVSNIGNHDTDNLSEGSSNLYFTNARADARVAAVHPNTDSLAEGSSNLYHTTERVQDIVGAMVSSNTESGITVTYEDGDGTLDFAISDTGSITEGSNLYFTNARADARIAAASISALSDVGSISGASAGQILVFDSNGDLQVANNSTTTDSTSEGDNKYFTDDRVNDIIVAGNGLLKSYSDPVSGTTLDGRTTLSVATENGVKLDGNHVELDYSVITDSDLTSGLPDGSGKDVGHLFFLI